MLACTKIAGGWHIYAMMLSSHLNARCVCLFLAECVMAELPSGLLEACVVIGAPSDKLRDIYQVYTHAYTRDKTMSLSNKKVCKQTDVGSIYTLHASCVNVDSQQRRLLLSDYWMDLDFAQGHLTSLYEQEEHVNDWCTWNLTHILWNSGIQLIKVYDIQ